MMLQLSSHAALRAIFVVPTDSVISLIQRTPSTPVDSIWPAAQTAISSMQLVLNHVVSSKPSPDMGHDCCKHYLTQQYKADYPMQDVLFNRTSGLWACCWNDDTEKLDCANPSNETFEALPPEQLFGSSTSVTTSSLSFETSISASSSVEIVVSFTSLSPESIMPGHTVSTASLVNPLGPSGSPLSPGGLGTIAQIGIGVGVSLGVVLLLVVLVCFRILRRRSQTQQTTNKTYELGDHKVWEEARGPTTYTNVNEVQDKPQAQRSELGNAPSTFTA